MWFEIIKSEFYKVFITKTTFFFLIIVLLLSSLLAAVDFKKNSRDDINNWKPYVENKVKVDKNSQVENKGTGYPQTELEKNKLYLKHNVNPYESNQYTFLGNSLGMLSLIILIMVITSTKIINIEYKSNTIKSIIISPISSAKLIFCKYIAMIIYMFFWLTILFSIGLIIGMVLYNHSEWLTKFVYENQSNIFLDYTIFHIFKIYAADGMVMLVFISLMFFLATLTKNSTIPIVLGMLTLIFSKNISNFLAKYEWNKYLIFNNLNLREYFNLPGLITQRNIDFLPIGICIIYIVLFLFLSIVLFKWKKV